MKFVVIMKHPRGTNEWPITREHGFTVQHGCCVDHKAEDIGVPSYLLAHVVEGALWLARPDADDETHKGEIVEVRDLDVYMKSRKVSS